MGNTPAQKRQKELRGIKKKRRRKRPADPRISEITIGGPIKITKANGTVEIQPASPGWKNILKKDYLGNPYSKPRPKKY